MKNLSIEQRLIEAGRERGVRDEFVAATMKKIQKASHAESFAGFVRTTNEPTNQKGRSFMKKLLALPTGALAAMVVAAVLLTAGATYAAVVLWKPFEIHQKSTTTKDGRTKTTFSLSGCSTVDSGSQSSTIDEAEITAEVKARGGITPEEAQKYVTARCEHNMLAAYMLYLYNAEGIDPKGQDKYGYDFDVLTMPSEPFDRVAPGGESGSVQGAKAHYRLTDTTKYYRNNTEITSRDIPEGSGILVVYENVSSTKREAAAVFATTVDKKYFDALTDPNGQVVMHVPCENNPTESCQETSGFPLYSVGPETSGPDYVPTPQEKRHLDAISSGATVQYEGEIVKIEGDTITLRTSSDRIMLFSLPEGRVAAAQKEYDEAGLHLLAVGGTVSFKTVGDIRNAIPLEDLVSAYFPVVIE